MILIKFLLIFDSYTRENKNTYKYVINMHFSEFC